MFEDLEAVLRAGLCALAAGVALFGAGAGNASAAVTTTVQFTTGGELHVHGFQRSHEHYRDRDRRCWWRVPGGDGWRGRSLIATVPVAPGEQLFVVSAASGLVLERWRWRGLARRRGRSGQRRQQPAMGGGGGGRSWVLSPPRVFDNRLVVAGGGGGAGEGGVAVNGGNAGAPEMPAPARQRGWSRYPVSWWWWRCSGQRQCSGGLRRLARDWRGRRLQRHDRRIGRRRRWRRRLTPVVVVVAAARRRYVGFRWRRIQLRRSWGYGRQRSDNDHRLPRWCRFTYGVPTADESASSIASAPSRRGASTEQTADRDQQRVGAAGGLGSVAAEASNPATT